MPDAVIVSGARTPVGAFGGSLKAVKVVELGALVMRETLKKAGLRPVTSEARSKIEPDLFETVTGLTVKDFHLLVRLRVFNTEQMNAAVFAFRRYEDASLRYTGIESHDGLTHYGLYDTVVARE